MAFEILNMFFHLLFFIKIIFFFFREKFFKRGTFFVQDWVVFCGEWIIELFLCFFPFVAGFKRYVKIAWLAVAFEHMLVLLITDFHDSFSPMPFIPYRVKILFFPARYS